jgi:hypothetical protein
VRRIFVRTVLAWLAARAARAGVARGRSGAVVVAQRFGSALNLNLHFHAVVLDGVYASPDPLTRPRFHPAASPTDRDVEELTALLHRRIRRHLSRTGPLRRNADEFEREPDEPVLAELYAASVQGSPPRPRSSPRPAHHPSSSSLADRRSTVRPHPPHRPEQGWQGPSSSGTENPAFPGCWQRFEHLWAGTSRTRTPPPAHRVSHEALSTGTAIRPSCASTGYLQER